MTGQAVIVQGDALHLPLPDGSVDLIVTSPPYLWKRAYAITGTGELGNERDWRQYLANLYAVTDEMLRVLKGSGSIFVNLGDTRVSNREPKWLGVPPKSKLLLPERYRVGCQDRYAAAGVIMRQVQLWEKANGLPESVTDRTRDTHEDWVHIVKRPNYYSAVDELRTAPANHYHDRPQYQRAMQLFREAGFTDAHMGAVRAVGVIDSGAGVVRSGGSWGSESGQLAKQVRDRLGSYYRELCGSNTAPLGTLPGSVWKIASEPLHLPKWLGVDHYAAFASEWPRRLVLAFSPPGICLDCGQGRVPVVERDRSERHNGGRHPIRQANPDQRHGVDATTLSVVPKVSILGYACGCTPHTNHPGSGESSGPSQAASIAAGGYPLNSNGQPRDTSHPGHAGVWDRPKVGPWREYHLDRWQAPPTRPAIILDPFSGVGTTVGVAKRLGRIGIGVDLSAPYSRAARWRVHDPDQFGKAEGRSWLERQGQLL